MIENLPKLMSDTKPLMQEVQKTPSRINPDTVPPPLPPHSTATRHIIFQTIENQRQKNFERSQQRKHFTYRRAKTNPYQPRFLYPENQPSKEEK